MLRDAHVSARQALHPQEVVGLMDGRKAMLDDFEAHGRDILGGLVERIRGVADGHEWVTPILDQLAGPQSFTATGEIFAAVFAVVFTVIQQVVQPFVQPLVNEAWKLSQAMPLSAADVALNELRGGQYKGAGAGEASLTGIDASRYEAILYNTGEPLALEQMLFLLRRGLVGEGDVDKAIRQSRVRDEWIPDALNLKWGPPSAADAIAAAVRNLMDDGTASDVVQQNGIDPKWYDVLRQSAGRPPGIAEFGELVNRGLATDAEWAQAIRESDIKDKYIPQILQLRERLMPERTVVSGISKGVLTYDQGVERLLLLGFSPTNAAILASEASSTKAAKHRELSEALITEGYRLGKLTRTEAVTELDAIGYDDTEAAYVLDLEDAKIVHAQHNAALNKVRALYIAHKLDQAETTAELVNLSVPAGQAQELVGLWTLERDAQVAELSVADLGHLLVLGWLTPDEYQARLIARGYSQEDAALKLAVTTKSQAPAPVA